MLVAVLVFVGAFCFPSEGFLLPHEVGHEEERKCELKDDEPLLASYCVDMQLTTVPDDIKTDIVILDLRINRLRELENTSFVNYSALQYLYLQDNIISFIDIGTFYSTPDLKVLDLSINVLRSVPEAINSLTVLRELHLDYNVFPIISFKDELPSIDVLGLSGCRLEEFPNFEALPQLQHLNLSNNSIETVSIQNLGPLCHLKSLDLKGNKKLFAKADYACDCSDLTKWSQRREINITPYTICQQAFDDLSMPFDNSTCFTNETESALQESKFVKQCKVQVLVSVPETTRCTSCEEAVKWTKGVFGAGLFFVMVRLAWLHARKVILAFQLIAM